MAYLPVEVRIAECSVEQDTPITGCPYALPTLLKACGVSAFLIASPNPSAPLSPEPQDMTDPLSVTTKVCNLPHATILIGVLLNELTK